MVCGVYTLIVMELLSFSHSSFWHKSTCFNNSHGDHTASLGPQHTAKWLLGMSGSHTDAQKGHSVRPSWNNCEKRQSWFTRENGRTCQPLNLVQPNMSTVIDNSNNIHNPLSRFRCSHSVKWNTQKLGALETWKWNSQREIEVQKIQQPGNKLLRLMPFKINFDIAKCCCVKRAFWGWKNERFYLFFQSFARHAINLIPPNSKFSLCVNENVLIEPSRISLVWNKWNQWRKINILKSDSPFIFNNHSHEKTLLNSKNPLLKWVK